MTGLPRTSHNEFTTKLIQNFDRLCCTMDKHSHHTHSQNDWANKSTQGKSFGHLLDMRAPALTNFLNIRRLRGFERVIVCKFSLDGFHRRWCLPDETHSEIDCCFNGTICI